MPSQNGESGSWSDTPSISKLGTQLGHPHEYVNHICFKGFVMSDKLSKQADTVTVKAGVHLYIYTK
mgnify:CR=1 FL=1